MPVFEKDSKSDKSNYQPISILPNLSIWTNYAEPDLPLPKQIFFSKYQCSFGKGFSAQHCVIAVIEKWCQSLDSGGQAAAVLTDLTKAFDCNDHELLIAKLNADGINQRTKTNSSFSCWAEILFGAPQGSILGPYLALIYVTSFLTQGI